MASQEIRQYFTLTWDVQVTYEGGRDKGFPECLLTLYFKRTKWSFHCVVFLYWNTLIPIIMYDTMVMFV